MLKKYITLMVLACAVTACKNTTSTNASPQNQETQTPSIESEEVTYQTDATTLKGY